MKQNYEEVIKQPCDKLAQTMSDMTYCYEETVVPKNHYKKLLSKEITEVVADSVNINMTNIYFKTLKELEKGNREWFIAAILYVEFNINPAKASLEQVNTIQNLTHQLVSDKIPIINDEIANIIGC